MHEPLGLCLQIMEDRAYARAKDRVDRTEKLSDLPDDPIIGLVQEIEFDIAKEARLKRIGNR